MPAESFHIILPHQLYPEVLELSPNTEMVLFEEPLMFSQYAFHQTKLWHLRASLKSFEATLQGAGFKTRYIEFHEYESLSQMVTQNLKAAQTTVYAPSDDWISRQIKSAQLQVLDNPHFLTSMEDLKAFFGPQKKQYLHHHFYKKQRQRLEVLVDEELKPIGGQWSFDADNQKRLPKKINLPEVIQFEEDEVAREARNYVQTHFSHNPGELPVTHFFPWNREQALEQLEDFLTNRLENFGIYEDTFVEGQVFLYHSVLTPALNLGLLSPREVVDRTIEFSQENHVPLNSLEGFVRQIIGWREFVRGVYLYQGRRQRTHHFWNHRRKIPQSFYNGETGIAPIDVEIKSLNQYAYSHHIPRLMVLGNFMLLCEFDPDEVYRWFSELYIDAFDWVMVPNVYGMSQFADGGLLATKPYVSSSNYILKMSHYKKGEWCEIWDALYWRFLSKNQSFFKSNPRAVFQVKNLEKMDPMKLQKHLETAETFLAKLS